MQANSTPQPDPSSNEAVPGRQSGSMPPAHQSPEKLRLRRSDSVYLAMILLAGFTFLLDHNLPRGVGIGTLYLIIVLLSLLTRSSRSVLLSALATTLLIVVGWILSPPGAAIEYTVPDRIIAILVVWVIAFIGCKRIWFERQIIWLRDSQAWLSREVERRSRENLALALALTSESTSVALVRSRLEALGALNDQLARSNWRALTFREIFLAVMPRHLANCTSISGQCSPIPPTHAALLGLVIHELKQLSLTSYSSDALQPRVWIQIRQLPTCGASDLRLALELAGRAAAQ